MARRGWTDAEFVTAAGAARSVAEALKALGLHPTGGNYASFRRYAERLGVDVSGYAGQAHLRGKTHGWAPAAPLASILREHSGYTDRNRLKLRLLRAGLLEYACSICGIDEWRGRPISLQLDHVNGVSDDHRLENLRLLCPNCHSQTESFAGRNKARRARRLVAPDPA